MTEYLVFTLAAPMGSFGGLAGHERRGSDIWPKRSAILGVLGAALGIERSDAVGQGTLKRWKVAVSMLSESVPLRDFHTVQTVPSTKVKRPNSRKQALNRLKEQALSKLKKIDNPVITRRDYRCDCVFGVALRDGPEIEEARNALERPVFTPYLGRKSCPLSAPMAPHRIQAANAVEALNQAVLPPYLRSLHPILIASDEVIPGARQETFWDDPLDREAWHFGPRVVHVYSPEDC